MVIVFLLQSSLENLKILAKSFIKKSLFSFWQLHKILVKRNIKFKNKHDGETCLIIANGGSLKSYDISNISQLPAIGCTYTLIDKRAQTLNMQYLVFTEQYLFYPLFYNFQPAYKKIIRLQKNIIRKIFEKTINRNSNINFFINLTNFYARVARNTNVHYFYHFGDKTSDNYDLAGDFSAMQGALEVMLSTAQYLGFSKAILLGCDYLGKPVIRGHFYADSKPFYGVDYLPEYCQRIKTITKDIDLLVILPEGITSPDFDFKSYEEYFGLKRDDKKNIDFIDDEYIELLREAGDAWQVYMHEHQNNNKG